MTLPRRADRNDSNRCAVLRWGARTPASSNKGEGMRSFPILEGRGRAGRKLASLAVLGITVIAVAAFALAANTKPTGAAKAPLYGPNAVVFTCQTGGAPTPDTFGFVVLNSNNSGDLIANYSVKNGSPNATYDIYLNQDPPDCSNSPSGTLTTNSQGNGNAQVVEPRLTPGTNVWVSAVES